MTERNEAVNSCAAQIYNRKIMDTNPLLNGDKLSTYSKVPPHRNVNSILIDILQG